MNKELEKLETSNKEKNGITFIKKYEILKEIKSLTPNQIDLIELILSFQSKGSKFQMRYQKIAKRIGVKSKGTVKNYVSTLKKLGILTTNNEKNVIDGDVYAGSKTYITVNIGKLNQLIEESSEAEAKQEPEEKPANTPTPKEEKKVAKNEDKGVDLGESNDIKPEPATQSPGNDLNDIESEIISNEYDGEIYIKSDEISDFITDYYVTSSLMLRSEENGSIKLSEFIDELERNITNGNHQQLRGEFNETNEEIFNDSKKGLEKLSKKYQMQMA